MKSFVVLCVCALVSAAAAGNVREKRGFLQGLGSSGLVADPFGYSTSIGYQAPYINYAAPLIGYAAPRYSYAEPSIGYAAPSIGYAVSPLRYSAPFINYAASPLRYSAPSIGYAGGYSPLYSTIAASRYANGW